MLFRSVRLTRGGQRGSVATMDETRRRAQSCPCPACDASGRVPSSPGELGRGCYQAALAAVERKRANGGQWPAEDLEYDARVRDPRTRGELLRRLTLKLCDAAQMLAVADKLQAQTESVRRAPRVRR